MALSKVRPIWSKFMSKLFGFVSQTLESVFPYYGRWGGCKAGTDVGWTTHLFGMLGQDFIKTIFTTYVHICDMYVYQFNLIQPAQYKEYTLNWINEK